MFGHTWLRDQGDEPNDTWIRGLSDLSPADLGCGLIACRDSGKTFPPTLPEFRSMCRPDHGMTAMEKASLKEYRPERLLEDETSKAAAREAGAKVLAELKSLFGGMTA
jgi:hypothetical protein